MTAILLTARTFVALHGRIIEPGTVFACEKDYAKKLVTGGSAELNLSKNAVKNGENTGGNGDGKSAQTPPESTDLASKLDDLTVEKLKGLAQKHEISLESATKKAEIIEKIIASGVVIDETDV